MIKDPKVSGDDLGLKDRSGGDVDPVPVVCNDDHRAPQAHWGGMCKVKSVDNFFGLFKAIFCC